jgi:hypothetical protein
MLDHWSNIGDEGNGFDAQGNRRSASPAHKEAVLAGSHEDWGAICRQETTIIAGLL